MDTTENQQEPVGAVKNIKKADRLFDGYDADGRDPPKEYIKKLMDGAPKYIKDRQIEANKSSKLEE